jgi:hypothetical protein
MAYLVTDRACAAHRDIMFQPGGACIIISIVLSALFWLLSRLYRAEGSPPHEGFATS